MNEHVCNENLRRIRRAKDFTQEFIAFELGISQKAYSEIENGKTKMRDDLLLKLSSILAISPFDICTISCQCNNRIERKLNKLLDYLKDANIVIPNHILEE
ncbi:helix-turn-helix domain-containing protein [Chryseobacterium taichungense]|uniref:helix-turn-helix domain-containing protein n=1 Tax=Chryseobacterium taichungense TaxID=295069 RepID=UPI0028ABD141|nr:helix-turn-helix transcriptional regulator [Chryseobacterium taichungense]